MTYAQQCNYLIGMTQDEAARLAHHGNPQMALAGRLLVAMTERHANGEYNRSKDAQTSDSVLSSCTVDVIAEYLSTPRWNAPHAPIWEAHLAANSAARFARSEAE